MQEIYLSCESVYELIDMKNMLDTAGYKWNKTVIMTTSLYFDTKDKYACSTSDIKFTITQILWMDVIPIYVEE